MSSRQLFIVSSVVILLLAPLSYSNPSLNLGLKSMTPAGVEVISLIDDTDILSEPEVTINGTYEGYSWEHESTDSGHINLTWSHEAGTPLMFNANLDDDKPECWDYIFFSYDFQWDVNKMPSGVVGEIEYAAELSGDFAGGTTMPYFYYGLFVWFIDSSGQWTRVFKSYPPYFNTTDTHTISFNYFDIVDIFRGIVTGGPVEPQDPTNIVEIRIGLTPLLRFQNDTYHPEPDYEPWKNISGEVTFMIHSIDFAAFVDDGDVWGDEPPLANGSWISEYGGWLEEIEVASDGCAYTVGYVSSYEQQLANLILVKWNQQAQPVWYKMWGASYRANGEGVAIDGNSIYTVGREWTEDGELDFLIAKWDAAGNRLWTRNWDDNGREEGKDVAVASDGSIYAVGYSYKNMTYEHQIVDGLSPFLLKYNSEGELQWNVTCGWKYWGTPWRVRVGPDDSIFTLSDYLIKWNANGDQIWNKTPHLVDFDIASDGSIIGIGNQYGAYGATLYKYDTQCVEQWNRSITVKYNDKWEDFCTGVTVAVASDDSIRAIVDIYHMASDRTLFTFDSSGQHISNQSLGAWVGLPGYHCSIDTGPSDLTYVAGMRYEWTVEIYGEAIPGPLIDIPYLIIGATLVVGIIIIVIVILRKKQS